MSRLQPLLDYQMHFYLLFSHTLSYTILTGVSRKENPYYGINKKELNSLMQFFNAILLLIVKSFRLSLLDFACSFYYYLLIVVVLYGTSRPEFNHAHFITIMVYIRLMSKFHIESKQLNSRR